MIDTDLLHHRVVHRNDVTAPPLLFSQNHRRNDGDAAAAAVAAPRADSSISMKDGKELHEEDEFAAFVDGVVLRSIPLESSGFDSQLRAVQGAVWS